LSPRPRRRRSLALNGVYYALPTAVPPLMCAFAAWRNPHIPYIPYGVSRWFQVYPPLPSRISVTIQPYSSSMASCDTFREELASTYPHHGHALWDPDPGGLCDSVAVGHVGIIRDGCFYPLFNALSPPSDSDSLKYPPKLQLKKSPPIRRSTDNQRYFYSNDVTRVSCDSNPYTLG